MVRQSRILNKLEQDLPSWCIALYFTDPTVYEMAALVGVDGIWMDLEHHGYSVATAGNLMRAARVGGADIVARPAKGEFMQVGRLLELGATGIMYPRCDGAEEAARVVQWAKFAPRGKRGFDGSGPDVPYAGMSIERYLRAANERTFLIIQIEEEHALQEAEAIAAVEGVDFLMLGPGDYSILAGIPGQFDHPKVTKAIEKVATAARNTGKHWAATCPTIEQAREWMAAGCRLVFHQLDLFILKNELESLRQSFVEAGVALRPSRLGDSDPSPKES